MIAEMETEHTFQINPEVEEIIEERKVTCFTIKGKEDFLDREQYTIVNVENDIRTHAKLVKIGPSKRYYVKRGKSGRLFNPLGLFDENQQLKQMRHASRPAWQMRMTNEKVFANYVEFLKTKNLAFLRNAEREEV